MRPLSLLIPLLFSLAAVAQKGPCSEQAIKTQTEKIMTDAAWADDAYFFSGALEKPAIGRAAMDAAFKPVAARRKNEKQSPDHVERVVVSPSGDMAYEYGTFHMNFDQDKEHVDFTGAFLRVWRAVGGECKIVAMMAQPEGER